MKRIFTLIAFTVLLPFASHVNAQSFTQLHDTVYLNASVNDIVLDSLFNTGSGNITLEWRVISTDFPSDWLGATGICDNRNCYTVTGLWPSGTMTTSDPYATGQMDVHLQFTNALATSAGCHYIRVRLNNKFATSDTAIATFKVCRSPTRVPTVKPVDEVQLYPNPASNELNVVFDANADVNLISVYNLIGKVVSVYRVSGNSANLNLENVPSGIYFLRLMSSNGQVVATRKFTKQ